jgi:hypothetical protein
MLSIINVEAITIMYYIYDWYLITHAFIVVSIKVAAYPCDNKNIVGD